MFSKLTDLRVKFTNVSPYVLFVTLWPYVFLSFWKKVCEKDKMRATWLATAGIVCDVAIAIGFWLDSYLLAIVASVAYAVLTWLALNVQMDD